MIGPQHGEVANSASDDWWRTAVIYEIYPRSFADANADGVGDIAGIRSHLAYLAELGVDAIWIAPWYPSPMKDGGYDIADYCNIDPAFGRLSDADGLFADAHALGIRVILDFVANHTSDQHPMFQAALQAPAGSPERDSYFFRDGKGPGGDEPPNDWISAFGGPAWTRMTDPDGAPGQWYLHLFAPEQPDVNWENAAVQGMFDDVIRFWFDRGVDGLRVDAASALGKKAGLPDAGHEPGALFASSDWVDNPHWDVDDLHQVLRRWRKIGDGYPKPKIFVTEAVVNGPERLSRYVRPDEMHTTFNFDYLKAGWSAPRIRQVIDGTLQALAPVGAPATWVLSSHDETRHLTRFGRTSTGTAVMGFDNSAGAADLELGTRRARAAALLTLALPGGAYIYQGEELGLPEVEDLPEDLLQDPTWERSGHTARGRDGCRVPLPWSGATPPFGFSADGVEPWLPQPADWHRLTVAAEQTDPDSMLSLYRRALSLRRELSGWRRPAFAWLDTPPDVIAFERADGLRCAVNLSDDAFSFGHLGDVLLSSGMLADTSLPTDCAVWLQAR
ncbi:MAG: glycoside hydrolase family 13 protein [Nakamurella sp.]